MKTTGRDFEDEIKSWLQPVLKENFSVNVLGSTESGDGYMGDIVFVSTNGSKKLDLVLKCSKNSQALREQSPVKDVFLNEIFVYEVILPRLIQFQKEKGIYDFFDSVPKCYGSFIGENKEVIILENLKSSGYKLWPKRDPLTRKHIDLVIGEYAKFHATSLALEQEKPTEMQKFVDTLGNIYDTFKKQVDINAFFGTPINESYELLKDDLDKETLSKWLNFKEKVDFIFGEMYNNHTGLKVILHGDCWNNNFMFLHDEINQTVPLKVAFLDWQTARYNSPILDLSYFLFTCVSPEELDNLEEILNMYYNSFMNYLGRLGVQDPQTLYSHNQFFDDWKSYSKLGVLMANLLMKIVSTDKDEVIDIGEVADSGKPFTDLFNNEIKDKENHKRRIRPIVEYAVKHNLI